MRVLLLNQFFWPDSAATSQLLTDLARELARRGHEVHAISAASSYAVTDPEEMPPVTMHRVRASSFVRGPLGRVLSYGTFYLGAAWKSLTLPRQDVVLTLTTPPLLSLLGNLLRFVRGSKHYIWEMDVYPDVAVDVGYMAAGGITQKITGLLADWSRRYADGIIALGECMKERLVARGIPAERIDVCENWADSRAFHAALPGLVQDQLSILYSGNFGLAHDVDTIAGAMKELDGSGRFRFLFAGSGGRSRELIDFVERERIQSIEFLPFVKRADLGSSLAAGDVGLVTQRDACCGSVVPSKVYGLMAASRPILFIGPAASTPARMIERYECGWHIACGDVAGLSRLLLHLADHREELVQAGRRARQTFLDQYDLPRGTARIISVITGEQASQRVPRTKELVAVTLPASMQNES